MGRAYLIFIVVAGILGAMLPGGQSSAPSSSSSGIPDHLVDSAGDSLVASRGSSDSSSAPAEAGTIELKREGNGHFYADVQINSQTVRVLVDTGASGIALTRSDAQRAGLAVSIGMYNVVAKGADGDVRGEHVTLDRVSLGSASVEQVPAIVLDAGQQSLLGQSFLSQFASVEIRGDTMVLR